MGVAALRREVGGRIGDMAYSFLHLRSWLCRARSFVATED
jgi:hypothetical protein